jgi:transcription elongation factor SPT5
VSLLVSLQSRGYPLSFSKDGKLEPLEGSRDMGPPRGGFGDGGFGGGFGSSGGRTPNPYATSGGGGWGGGRTPNPYAAGGGKTPAWASSKTPNQEGGRTPFTTSSQTPNPYAQDGGGRRNIELGKSCGLRHAFIYVH